MLQRVARIALACALACACVPAAGARAQSDEEVRAACARNFDGTVSVATRTVALSASDRDTLRALCDRRFGPAVAIRVVTRGGATAGYGIVDDVRGKQLPITYLAIFGTDLAVRAVEILAYRESHGGEVASPLFRRQFAGKTASSPLRVGDDVRNVSGAKISARAITGGVRALVRLVAWLAAKGRLPAS